MRPAIVGGERTGYSDTLASEDDYAVYTVGFTQFHLSQATAGSWIFLILTAAIVGLLVRRLLKAEPT